MAEENMKAPEIRALAESKFSPENQDNVAWLAYMRDHAAADREEAFAANDILRANQCDAIARRYFSAITELKGLRKQMEAAERVLAERRHFVEGR